MKIAAVCLISAIAFAPLSAFAQSADAKYCDALSAKYREILGGTQAEATAADAMAKCKAGDTATGIPVLEKALKDAKATLPARN